MSSYEYNIDGRRFTADTSKTGDGVFITAQPTNVALYGIWIPNADIPTVAAELLKAAGRTDLAEYIGAVIEKEAEAARIAEAVSPQGLTRCHLCNEGIAQAKAAREAAEKANAAMEAAAKLEAAEKKLQERRDAIAREIVGPTFDSTWVDASAPIQRAIDRIIELEDGASRD